MSNTETIVRMNKAIAALRPSDREQIARELLSNPLPSLLGERVSSHCPLHSERTPGGGWFYDPVEDIGHCYSCGGSADLIGIYYAVKGLDVDDCRGFQEFSERYLTDKQTSGIALGEPQVANHPPVTAAPPASATCLSLRRINSLVICGTCNAAYENTPDIGTALLPCGHAPRLWVHTSIISDLYDDHSLVMWLDQHSDTFYESIGELEDSGGHFDIAVSGTGRLRLPEGE